MSTVILWTVIVILAMAFIGLISGLGTVLAGVLRALSEAAKR